MALNRKRLVYFEKWFDPVAVDILSQQEDIELVRLELASPEADNWSELSRACGYQVSAQNELREPWYPKPALLARCPNLLAVSSAGAGYDVIDVPACNKAGIIVVNQSGTNFEPVAEHAIGLILGLSKKIALSNRVILKGGMQNRMDYAGNNVQYKTVGIVGIGKIGSRVAKFCQAFDMKILAYDPYLTKEQIAARGATKVELGELLAQSDFVTVHCPRTKETVNMIGAKQFAQMKPTAYFINTARGLIHNEKELYEALMQKTIAGAGIDVFDVEPPPSDLPLLQLPNVIATPHIAGATTETLHDMAKAAAEQWMDILRGHVPPRLVNPEIWPLYSQRFEQLIGFRPDPLP